MEEVRWYFLTILASIGIIFTNTIKIYGNVSEALCKASFQVASIITTTGFSTADFNTWSATSKTLLVILMFVGACAGSTGGGIKVSRFVIAIKSIFKEFRSYIHPKSVVKVRIDKKPLDNEVVRSTNAYFITFLGIFLTSVFLISFEDNDLITNFTAVAATINNIGPGLELVGPTENFAMFGTFSKYVLMFDMLAGRLELFPLLILFNPTLWKETAKQKRLQIKRRIGK
jgi:trk system potassium uptake protein TrkH